jgi:hypothetical protein
MTEESRNFNEENSENGNEEKVKKTIKIRSNMNL